MNSSPLFLRRDNKYLPLVMSTVCSPSWILFPFMFNNLNIGLDNLWKSSICFSTDKLWGWVKPRGKIWCRLLVNMSWKWKPLFYAAGLFQTLYLLFSQWPISNKLLWTHKIAISISYKYLYVGQLMSFYTSKGRIMRWHTTAELKPHDDKNQRDKCDDAFEGCYVLDVVGDFWTLSKIKREWASGSWLTLDPYLLCALITYSWRQGRDANWQAQCAHQSADLMLNLVTGCLWARLMT